MQLHPVAFLFHPAQQSFGVHCLLHTPTLSMVVNQGLEAGLGAGEVAGLAGATRMATGEGEGDTRGEGGFDSSWLGNRSRSRTGCWCRWRATGCCWCWRDLACTTWTRDGCQGLGEGTCCSLGHCCSYSKGTCTSGATCKGNKFS